jgi:hypothetical protein
MATVCRFIQALLWLHVAISNREAENENPGQGGVAEPAGSNRDGRG